MRAGLASPGTPPTPSAFWGVVFFLDLDIPLLFTLVTLWVTEVSKGQSSDRGGKCNAWQGRRHLAGAWETRWVGTVAGHKGGLEMEEVAREREWKYTTETKDPQQQGGAVCEYSAGCSGSFCE